MVIAPAADCQTGDVEVLQTYASGPHSEVNSIIWPNSEFDGDITVYGPEVKALVQRYLMQMLGELGAQPDPDGEGRTLLESIELIIPHQANKTMILNLAGKAGLSADQLYFNVERMGNVSAASIPIAVYDAVRDGVITEPVRVFAPGFGAGAVGGTHATSGSTVRRRVHSGAAGIANFASRAGGEVVVDTDTTGDCSPCVDSARANDSARWPTTGDACARSRCRPYGDRSAAQRVRRDLQHDGRGTPEEDRPNVSRHSLPRAHSTSPTVTARANDQRRA